MASRKNLSTFDVAEMLEVDPGSVANWIDGGLLKAYRTPGGHRRVAIGDLLDFLHGHEMPVPRQLQHGPVRVIVVDDEPAMTQMIAKAIRTEQPDFQVTEAHDGFRAGALVATLRPDEVVLDLRMPGMDGFEVCRQIKSQPATMGAVVIAITAYPTEEGHRRILECGAKLCMNKPLDLEALVAEVAVAVAENRG